MLQQRIQQQQAPPQATHVQLSVAEELAVIRAQSLRFRDSRKGIELERLELARQLQHLRQRHGHQLSVLHNLKVRHAMACPYSGVEFCNEELAVCFMRTQVTARGQKDGETAAYTGGGHGPAHYSFGGSNMW